MLVATGYLILAVIGALLICRRVVPSSPVDARPMILMIFCTALIVFPIHVVGLLQLLRAIRSVNVASVFAVEATLVLCLIGSVITAPALPEASRIQRKAVRPVATHLAIAEALIGLTYLLFVVRTMVGYPVGFDALAYHYPVALRWLQQGTVAITDKTPWQLSLPGNLETVQMVVLATGLDKALALVCVPFTALLALSIRVLCRVVFQATNATVPVTIIVLTIPIICYQTFSGYVDLFGASLLLASVSLLACMHDVRTGRARIAAAAGLACGLAAGTKPTFLPFCAGLFLVFTVCEIREQRCARIGIAKDILAFAGAAASMSAFWFIRAWYCTGNPFYPLGLRVAGLTLRGVSTSSITSPEYEFEFVRTRLEWAYYVWTEWFRHPGSLLQSYSEGSGLGGMFAALAVPGSLFAFFLSLRRKRRQRPLLWAFLCIALIIVAWAVLYSRIIRFVLVLPIAICLTAAPVISHLERSKLLSYRLLFLCSLVVTCGVLAMEPVHTIGGVIRTHGFSRSQFYSYPPFIDQLPPRTVIVNVGERSFTFPFAGRRLSNVVIAPEEVPTCITPAWLEATGVAYVLAQPSANPHCGLNSSAGLIRISEFRLSADGQTISDWFVYHFDHSRADCRHPNNSGPDSACKPPYLRLDHGVCRNC